MLSDVEAKARAIVAAGGVTVARHDAGATEAIVASPSGEGYVVGWSRADGWSCACPARRRCSHIAAVRWSVQQGDTPLKALGGTTCTLSPAEYARRHSSTVPCHGSAVGS